MTFYAEMQALADELLGTAEFGATLTIQGVPTPGDPVTGAGGSAGAARSIQGAAVKVDLRVFPETLVQVGDRMLITSDPVAVGEKWQGRAIVAVMEVKPDDATGILWKALVRG